MRNFQIMKFKRRCFFPSKDLWGQHYFFVTIEAQRFNRSVKCETSETTAGRGEGRGGEGRGGEGDWGQNSFFVSFEAQMVNKSVEKNHGNNSKGKGREKREEVILLLFTLRCCVCILLSLLISYLPCLFFRE